MNRLLRHLIATPRSVRRAFPPRALQAIEQEVSRSEAAHRGQIRFAVEAALDIGPLLARQTARERALEVFSELRVWDTEENNGVLLYLLLADRDVEIVADRGIAKRVPEREWGAICAQMEAALKNRDYEAAARTGVREIGAILVRHFPASGARDNVLSDAPALVR